MIGARDHARFGLLVARKGVWNGRSMLSDSWIDAMLTPSPTLAHYGYLWWLNTGASANPNLPASAVSALGAVTTVIWLAPEEDLVVVARWLDKSAVDSFLAHVVRALRPSAGAATA